MLPMPMDIEQIFETEWLAQKKKDLDINVNLIHNIEAIIGKWFSQIGDILGEESTKAFTKDKQPLPSMGIVILN